MTKPQTALGGTSVASVLENLTDEECALFAILSDESGLDSAEFLWYDPSVEDHLVCSECGAIASSAHKYEHGDAPMVERDDVFIDDEGEEFKVVPSGCFRAWAYQWIWWRCPDTMQIDQSARSVGKSLSIKVRGCCFPFVKPGQEMLITAPELVHLEPIVGLIESQVYSTRLYHEMLMTGRSGVTHRPFQMNFINNSRIIGRIPQKDGKGVKGMHPIWLEQDEAQDYPHDGWVELRETLKRGVEGARWRAHGVTRGIRDDFFEHTNEANPDNQWTVHRWSAMQRPNWTDQERAEKEEQYGSREDPDYKRNVLGQHGDSTNPIFVLNQLMKNVDDDPLSEYNTDEYQLNVIKVEQLQLMGQDMIQALDFPMGHLSYLGNISERSANPKAIYWVGMDVGYTIDPTEILVWVEYKEKPKDRVNKIKLLTRISLVRMPIDEQIKAMIAVIDFYKPKAFALDKGGNGLPLFQQIQKYVEHVRAGNEEEVPPWVMQYQASLLEAVTVIKGYNFSSKLLVAIDDSLNVDGLDDLTKAGLHRNAKDFATDTLREMVDAVQLILPWDDVFLKQLQGGTFQNTKGGMDQYGRKQYSKGNDHCLDASRFMALAWALHALEEMLLAPKDFAPVYDSFVSY